MQLSLSHHDFHHHKKIPYLRSRAAWALENRGFEVGITSLGNPDTIAAAVQKGNQELLDFINKDIEKLGKENFFHKAYEKTLHPTYGDAAKADDLVVEGGKVD